MIEPKGLAPKPDDDLGTFLDTSAPTERSKLPHDETSEPISSVQADVRVNESPQNEADVVAQLPIHAVNTSTGVAVVCSYMDHPSWDPTANICLSFHYIMVMCAPTRVSAWAFQLRLAIVYFLDFMSLYNSKHAPSLHIRHLKDITPSLFKSFIKHLNKIGKGAIHASKLKSCIQIASRETGVIPNVDLPKVRLDRRSDTEPLSEDGVATLTTTTKTIVDSLREMIARRAIIDEVAPYTLEELQDQWICRLSTQDIFTWYKYRLLNDLPIPKAQLMVRLAKCSDPEIIVISEQPDFLERFTELYKTAGTAVTIPPDYNPHPSSTAGWWNTNLEPYRVVKTFITYGYPLNFKRESLAIEYSSAYLFNYDDLTDPVKMIIHKLAYVRNKFNDKWSKTKGQMLSVDEHMALYYPTSADIAGLVLFMMLQAGWNKETVTDIDQNNYLHGLTSSIEENIKLIFSEKNRGQGGDLPYLSPKQILSTSDSENPYSLYNLILLSKDVSAPLAAYVSHLIDPTRNRPVNNMFAFLRPLNAWARAEGQAVGAIDYGGDFPTAVNQILSKHIVTDNGERITSANNLTGRLRSTWLYYNAEHTPYAFLSQMMGHESRDTTDESYDNSPVARAKRAKRLRSALERVVELLRARKFQGLLCKQASAIANADLSIIHLPYFERALWACSDRSNPDWPGAIKLQQGIKCEAFEHCIFCSKLRILEDSLPFLIERLSHIDELLRDRAYAEFGSQLEAEQQEIELILDNWNDEDAIQDAIRYRAANSPLLPREMRDLKLIFRTGEL
ncbi:hypothetical protein G7009_06015 [Pseudomonas capeferrum]|uniref:hypothetical protein n=1 Tax=Pseudomonas capeferrum TaxID=1495066 RepID=UPI0015E37ABD|nr:hypothetical protein [Pseudomonas capeferrum]MBA1201324.1 hypothetical protein [Pseudomonas capeferrum]